MRKEDNPCYGCQKRHMTCHTECKAYFEYVAGRVVEKTAKKEYLANFGFDSYDSEKAKRLKKLKRERSGR